MLHIYFDYCQVGASVLTAIAGVFGALFLAAYAVVKCIETWAKVARINGALLEFYSWKMQRERQEKRERLMSVASKATDCVSVVEPTEVW